MARSPLRKLTTLALKFGQARSRAGLPENLVLYCGRHDFGTRVLNETDNLKPVMQAMGHADVKTAMKYHHPELDFVRSAPNKTNAGWSSTVPSDTAVAHFTAHIEEDVH